jgi:hypothetical protein
MLRKIVMTMSAAALAASLATAPKAEAHPMLLFAAPVLWHAGMISAGWAAAAGLGGVLVGGFLGNAFFHPAAPAVVNYIPVPPVRPHR